MQRLFLNMNRWNAADKGGVRVKLCPVGKDD
jgi:hypothetical protein